MRSRATLHLEILALRHQLHVLQRSQRRRLHLANADRWLWGVVVTKLGTLSLRHAQFDSGVVQPELRQMFLRIERQFLSQAESDRPTMLDRERLTAISDANPQP